ncbi:MAG: DUF1329 domain-containing protein [Candidatus Binatia bacterium]
MGRIGWAVGLAFWGMSGLWVEAGPPPIDRPWPPDPKRYEPVGREVAPGLRIGDTVDEKNADLAKDLLPPEIYAHYRKGEYRNDVASWPTGLIHWDHSFEEATRENTTRLDVDEHATIVERATGKQPDYVYGIPFPKLDANDPKAGVKAVWNQFHNYWNVGGFHYHALIVWLSSTAKDRESMQDVYFAFYENQSALHRLPNPGRYEWQSLSVSLTPADMQGTAALVFRYLDPERRDAVWTYVPALRRVRAVSPSNRSDGFLGSDLSQDDGHFFDAKPQDFTWKTIGMREGFRISEPYSIRGAATSAAYQADTGGWRSIWTKGAKVAGYAMPGWTGVAWAPTDGVLTKRKFWVVEGVPKDRYYLFGRIELWIDAESWIGAWARKFSWTGELLNTYQVNGYLNAPALRDGMPEVEWIWTNEGAWQCAENLKAGRATLAGIRADPTGLFDRRVKLNPERTFDLQALSRLGK